MRAIFKMDLLIKTIQQFPHRPPPNSVTWPLQPSRPYGWGKELECQNKNKNSHQTNYFQIVINFGSKTFVILQCWSVCPSQLLRRAFGSAGWMLRHPKNTSFGLATRHDILTYLLLWLVGLLTAGITFGCGFLNVIAVVLMSLNTLFLFQFSLLDPPGSSRLLVIVIAFVFV